VQIAGSRAVVTGAGGVLGRSLGVELARRGAASVVLVDDRNGRGRALEQTAALVCAHGALAEVEFADVGNEREVACLVQRVEDAGPVDLWCSNATLAGRGGLETDPEELSLALAVNLLSHVWTAKALLPRMIARGGGSFLQTTSAAAILPEPQGLALGVSHGGAVAFAEWLATAFFAQGIRVSCLFPAPALLDEGVSAQAERPTVPRRHDTPRPARGPDHASRSGPDEPTLSSTTGASMLARTAVDALEAERFYVFPEAEISAVLRRKAEDPEAWMARQRRPTPTAEGPSGGPGPDRRPVARTGRTTAETQSAGA